MAPDTTLTDHAASWARIARRVIGTPYPYSSGHTAHGPDDTNITPQLLHPAFHGSLDWHSCVHMQWSLVTLLDRQAQVLEAEGEVADTVALLEERLTPEHLEVEVDYLRARPGFERPYGWAWAAMLAGGLRRLADGSGPAADPAARWAGAVAPLADLVAERVVDWLPRQDYPVRHGKHQNDAFAMSLLLRAFGPAALDRPEVVAAVRGRALDWFAGDTAYGTRTEPSGTDFLSPALSEAELMSHLLGEEFGEWLRTFLPGLGQGDHEQLLAVPAVGEGTDGQLAHLLGLSLSRAWQLRVLAPHLDPEAAGVLRAGADAQVAAVLPEITDGDFMATHWLVSFALLASGA